MPALPAVSARLDHSHAVPPERLQRGLDVVQLERLYDRGDELHTTTLSLSCQVLSAAGVSGDVPECIGGVKPEEFMLRARFLASGRFCASRRRPERLAAEIPGAGRAPRGAA